MTLDLQFYWKLLLRRFPVMVLLVIVCAGLGVISAIRLPDTYSSSARLLVEAPQIPGSMVSSTVDTNAIEQLDILQQRLTTRANLIDIANKFKAFPNIRQMTPDAIVSAMQSSLRISRSAGRNKATMMTISFQSGSGRTAANVVNEFVTIVLEENSDFRTSRAENTLGFFQQELARLSSELDNQSAKIAAFKSENADALPQDQSYRLGRQSLLTERLGRLERDLTSAQAQRTEINRIYETTGRLGPQNNTARRTPEEQQLVVARAELEHARSVYSETSPRVIRHRALVERLEAIVAAQAIDRLPQDEDEDVSPDEVFFNATIAEIDTRIGSIQDEIESITTELDKLQDSISKSSAIGIQLDAMQREFSSIQSRYATAEKNMNEAHMSERIESTAQGQRITVIENANVPSRPTGPDRTKIATMGTLVGLGLAAGYFALLEVMNRSIRRPAELVSRYNVTPITTIPYMESAQRKFMRRSGMIGVTVAVIIGVPAVLWYIDTNYMPLELFVQKAMNKLGIG